MNTHSRKFTPESIMARALEYGIRLYLSDGELMMESPPELDLTTRDKALAVITDAREEIIAYLGTLDERYQHEMEQQMQRHPEICCVCLEEGKETSAWPDDHEGLMYCVEHHPRVQKAELWKPTTCHAVWHLNELGLPAKAREKVAKIEECGGTVWLQTPTGVICAKCYTPR